jgi:hypothetical protein
MSTMKISHRIITAPQPVACGEQPLTGLDIGMPVDSFCIALVYQQPLDELLVVASLQKALDRNPYFSGRLFGIGSTLPLVIPNNAGALFTCNAYPRSMPAFGIDQPLKPHLLKFAHCIQSFGFDHHTPPLQVQLTSFPNGCILAISISHALCDGTSMLEFIRSWAGYALQAPTLPQVDWNRRDVQQMALGDGIAPSPQAPVVELKQPFPLNTQPTDTAIFHLSAAMLDHLCDKHLNRKEGISLRDASHQGISQSGLSAQDTLPLDASLQEISRQDIAAAFIYLLLLRCGNDAKSGMSLSIVCNIRRILELPANYLGNAVCLRHFQPSSGQLRSMDIRTMARQIRSMHSEITTGSLRRDLAFWQRRAADGTAARFMPLATQLALTGGILIDNMSKFGFYELDFGVGKPAWIDTPPPPSPAAVARGVLMLPAPPRRGGIDLHVSLLPGEMATLRALMEGAHMEKNLYNEAGFHFASTAEPP